MRMIALNCNKKPGVVVNRPRYTIELYFAIVCLIWYAAITPLLQQELAWIGVSLPFPRVSVNGLCNAYVIIMMTGGHFIDSSDFSYLRVKAKSVYASFLEKTRLLYLGKRGIHLNNVGGVLHPVDHFIKQLYDRHFPRACSHAMSTYKRTNPTLQLKLDHLEKFADPHVEHIPRTELEAEMTTFVKSLKFEDGFANLRSEISENVKYGRFGGIVIDGASAAGYPYRQGRKKRDERISAELKAHELLHDDLTFADYMSEHVWYTTGRARMQAVGDAVAGRLIIYGGFAYLLLAMLVIQPWSLFMNKTYSWCGVGFSWMNGGAGKLARHMQAEKGFAPKGFRYVSLDISGWDTKLHAEIMACLVSFYCQLCSSLGLDGSFTSRMRRIVEDMVSASILMPMGYCFKVFQGMKSGWAGTANDNTLLHELIFRCVMKRVGFILHVLYGDDNLMLVPDHISDEDLVKEYWRFGLKVKHIHSSRYLGDVDFLSKHIHYADGHYYVFRDSVETHSRILMPEEMDPRRRDRPDPVIAAERLLGHLLDNPFNREVRETCISLLGVLKERYSVSYIEVNADLVRNHPWRNFDLTKIPKRFPTVPDDAFIEELYGVPIPSHLQISWPSQPIPVRFDVNLRASDSVLYDSAALFCNDVAARVNSLAGKKSKMIVRKLSPFSQPKRCYGFHAARLEFAIRFFGIGFDSMLDFGSHPGACAASALKYCNDVVCVSRKPGVDKGAFCPYVVNDAAVEKIVCDADHYTPSRVFDLVHDDVDIVGPRTVDEDIQIGLGMIARAKKSKPHARRCLFTIKEIDWRVVQQLYDLYRTYGHIDFVKPLFSNPWKSEFMVYVRRSKRPRMRRAAFERSFNSFLNRMSGPMFAWGEVMVGAVSSFNGVDRVACNPSQSNRAELAWIKDWSS